MKKTAFLALGSLRVAAVLCLVPVLLMTPPATAAPVAQVSEKACLGKLAARIGDRAAFAAAIAPKLTPLFQKPVHGHTENRRQDTLIERLWLLRFAPDLQQQWIDKLTAGAVPLKERHVALKQFSRFMRERIAEADSLAIERNILVRPSHHRIVWDLFFVGDDPRRSCLTAEQLADTIAWEKAFADALLLYDLCTAAGVRHRDARPHTALLLSLHDREDRLLAAALIRNKDMPVLRKNALLQMLAEDAAGARDAIAAAENIAGVERRYRYVTGKEGANDAILLPLHSVLPEAVQTLELCGTIPLAEDAEQQETLASRALPRLLPKDFAVQGKDGTLSALPFLEEGERLYLVLSDRQGTAIFRRTPLDSLAYVGPHVVEYTEENKDIFLPFFSSAAPSSLWEIPVLIAAQCGPEELAAHLGGLAVMSTARERSLYGPFEDLVREHAADMPKDTKGKTLRLVQVTNPVLFHTLAPLADEDGLARLMGPIRGIWTRSGSRYASNPWTEMRYTPKNTRTESFPLGTAELLSLDNTALKALVAAQEQILLHAWAAFTARERCGGDERLCRQQYPVAFADMQRTFTSMRAKGFVSPFDMGAAAYLLQKNAKDGLKLEKLRVILDDSTLSSAKRVRAMQDADRAP